MQKKLYSILIITMFYGFFLIFLWLSVNALLSVLYFRKMFIIGIYVFIVNVIFFTGFKYAWSKSIRKSTFIPIMTAAIYPVFLSVIALYVVFSFIFYTMHSEIYFDPWLQIAPSQFSVSQKKQNNVFRILCLGGSTTECHNMLAQDKWPFLLEKQLQAQYPYREIQVLNAGKSWYTTKHSLINYVTYCNDYSPDLVIIMQGINDLTRSFNPTSFSLFGYYKEDWSHFYGPAIRAARRTTFEELWLAPLCQNFMRYIEIDYSLDRFKSLPMFRRHLNMLVKTISFDQHAVLLLTQPTMYKVGLSDDEKRHLYFGREMYAVDRGFLKKEFPSPGSLAVAMQSYDGVIKQIAQERNAYFLDIAAQLPQTLDYFSDDCHCTKKGYSTIAELIAHKIIEIGLIK